MIYDEMGAAVDKAWDDYMTELECRKNYLEGVIDCLTALNQRAKAVEFFRANINSLKTKEWIAEIKNLTESLPKCVEFDKLLEELKTGKYRDLPTGPRFPVWPSTMEFVRQKEEKE